MMKRKHVQQNNKVSTRGSTLLELLLYIAIVSSLLLSSGGIVLNILYHKAQVNAFEGVGYESRHALEYIERTFQDAQSIISPTQGMSNTSVSLSFSETSRNPTIFGVENGRLWVQEGMLEKQYLTSSHVTIESIFRNTTSTSTAETLSVELTIQSLIVRLQGGSKDVVRSFHATYNINRMP